MTVRFKRCEHPTATTKPAACSCEWHFAVRANGDRARGRAKRFAFLLLDEKSLPKGTSDKEASLLESAIELWLAQGRPAAVERNGIATTAPASLDAKEARPSDPHEAWIPHEHRNVTIGEAAKLYIADHCAELSEGEAASAASRMRKVSAALGGRPLIEILDYETVRNFLRSVERKTSGANANHYHARISNFINWSREKYKLTGRAPFFQKTAHTGGLKKRPEGHRSRRLSAAEEAALVKAFETLDDGGMMLGRFYGALDTGLRRGELLALRDVDIKEDKAHGLYISVRFEIAKTKKERKIPIESPRLRKFLQTRRLLAGGFVFGQKDGARLASFRTQWEHALIRSGLAEGTQGGGRWKWTKDADLNWHDLRHECGSRLAEAGVPPHEIKELLGHASLATTQRYLNPTFASLAANMRRAMRDRHA